MKKKEQANATTQTKGAYTFAPAITTLAFPIFFGKNIKMNVAVLQDKPSTPKPILERLTVTKYELSDIAVKFFNLKGFLKKRLVLIIEIPISEIASIENFGNELTITWHGSDYKFVSKKKNESFSSLVGQIRSLQEQLQKAAETEQEVIQIKNELSKIMNSSIDIVDLAFNILNGLSRKRIDWGRLEGYANNMESNYNSKEQTKIPLLLDFKKISAATKKQEPKTLSKETLAILRTIYWHFDNLKLDCDPKKASWALKNAKSVILAYYTLNDLMLGKIIGDSNSGEEVLALEKTLLELEKESSVKFAFEQLKINLDKLSVEGESGRVIEDTRNIFKEQLKLL
jgi:hypothetical protein